MRPITNNNQLKEMDQQSIRKIVLETVEQNKAQGAGDVGRPYPSHHDLVPYPLGYVVPKFVMFNGSGNPEEHLAHFRVSCGDTANNPSLLLRQFNRSLKALLLNGMHV
jgi:hypothetical protein